MDEPDLAALLDRAVAGDDAGLRQALMAGGGLPGRRDRQSVWRFADVVGALVTRPDPGGVDALEALLDGWAALPPDVARGDRPEVVLPCAAVAAYGQVGAVRPDWWEDEVAKLRRAASDPRRRVREVVAQALRRLLAAYGSRAIALLLDWADDPDPLVARAAVAGVADPRLLADADAGLASGAADVQRVAVANLGARPGPTRREPGVRALRTGLAASVSVTTAATGDFSLLAAMAASGDPDLRWAAARNLGRARLRPWPEEVARVRALLDG